MEVVDGGVVDDCQTDLKNFAKLNFLSGYFTRFKLSQCHNKNIEKLNKNLYENFKKFQRNISLKQFKLTMMILA